MEAAGLNPEEDGEDMEVDEDAGETREAWERAYADERSWETLQEDEHGRLRPVDVVEQQREQRRRLHSIAVPHVQRGIIRYLYVVADFSRAAAETDFRPSRMALAVNCVELFVREFFDQNPLSHLGLIVMRDGVAERLTDLSGSPESHIRCLRSNMECVGEASIQNALDCARGFLCDIPTYGHREVLLLFSALNTCDPGDIMESIKKCLEANIRCSVIGLAAEIFVCKLLCERTGGTYSVATSESHMRELVLEHAPPPPALAKSSVASLVRMGFPQRAAEGLVAICACHREVKVGGGYTCPRCRARICDLPTECNICGLTLVSAPHLARSYHHLFAVPPFEEVALPASAMNGKQQQQQQLSRSCFGCQQDLPLPGGGSEGVRLSCPRCGQHFCFDCDIYIHESLHNCPGCERNVGNSVS